MAKFNDSCCSTGHDNEICQYRQNICNKELFCPPNATVNNIIGTTRHVVISHEAFRFHIFALLTLSLSSLHKMFSYCLQ
jgi:hypothetical protein